MQLNIVQMICWLIALFAGAYIVFLAIVWVVIWKAKRNYLLDGDSFAERPKKPTFNDQGKFCRNID